MHTFARFALVSLLAACASDLDLDGVAVTDQPLGGNGLIAFSTKRDNNTENTNIYFMNGDGSGQYKPTGLNSSVEDAEPVFSPDGTKLAFMSRRVFTYGDIYIYTLATGTVTNVTNTSTAHEGSPAWSPDGTQIVFKRLFPSAYTRLFRIVVATGVETQLTTGNVQDQEPSWSPDGTKIAFMRGTKIHTINASDGSGLYNVSGTNSYDVAPVYAPGGTELLISRAPGLLQQADLIRVNATTGATVSTVVGGATWDTSAVYSPDGTQVAFTRLTGSIWSPTYAIFKKAADGTITQLTTSISDFDPQWQSL